MRLTNTREASWDLDEGRGRNGFLVQSVFYSALVMAISLVPARDQRLLLPFIMLKWALGTPFTTLEALERGEGTRYKECRKDT